MQQPFRMPRSWTVVVLLFLIVLLSLLAFVGERGALHLWRLRDEKQKLDETNFRLQKENEALRGRVGRLRNDDFYLEKMAREELNLVRSGEIIYRFPASEPTKMKTNAVTGSASEPRPSTAQKERQ
jgi:cell division protein FtsB